MTDPKTRKGEINGLIFAMEEFDLPEGLILIEDYDENIEINGREIKVLPIWYWLLSQ